MISPRARGALLLFLLVGCAEADPTTSPLAAPDAAASRVAFPDVIPLPLGFSPEGIVIGNGTDFYVGSLLDGSIYSGDLRTGAGEILIAGQAGNLAVGLAFDPRTAYLYVAGGFGAEGRVYDTRTGDLIGSFAAPGGGFINDVIVTRTAAWFTDSFTPTLYQLPLEPGGEPAAAPDLETVPLGGDFTSVPGAFNANGIVATSDGSSLIVVNGATGDLYRVDPETGTASTIDVGGPLLSGDGLVRSGRTLYVVQNFLNQIAKVQLAPDLESGQVVGFITSPDFRIPTTADLFGSSLYAVNARFDVAPPGLPNAFEFEVVRVPR